MSCSIRIARLFTFARVPLLSVVLLSVSACAAPLLIVDFYDMDSETLKRYAGMQFVAEQSISEDEYIDLGAVQGLYCHKTQGELYSGAERDAVDQVKLKAAAIDADHMITPQCVIDERVDLTNNCFSKTICSSRALKAVSL